MKNVVYKRYYSVVNHHFVELCEYVVVRINPLALSFDSKYVVQN